MIHQSGNKLRAEDAQTLQEREGGQVETLKKFFDDRPNQNYSSEEVHRLTLPKCPLTSIRRALSDLAKSGYIRKDEEVRKQGQYGIKIVTWVKRMHILKEPPTLFETL